MITTLNFRQISLPLVCSTSIIILINALIESVKLVFDLKRYGTQARVKLMIFLTKLLYRYLSIFGELHKYVTMLTGTQVKVILFLVTVH